MIAKTNRKDKLKSWLWFISLYIAGVVTIAGISYGLKLLLPV